jgi:hypothetical protein
MAFVPRSLPSSSPLRYRVVEELLDNRQKERALPWEDARDRRNVAGHDDECARLSACNGT